MSSYHSWYYLHLGHGLPGDRTRIFLVALNCLTTGDAFDWTSASAVGNGSTKRTRELIEALNTTPTCVHQCTTKDPCFKALHQYLKGKGTLSQTICRPPPHFSCYYWLNTPYYAIINLISSYLRLILMLPNSTRNFLTTPPDNKPEFRIKIWEKYFFLPTQVRRYYLLNTPSIISCKYSRYPFPPPPSSLRL